MSFWMVSEVVRMGGEDNCNLDEERWGHFRATYRGYYLWWIEVNNSLHVAKVDDFDRWANSRVYEGQAPWTIEALDDLLTELDNRLT